jgi:outer membrane protein assembly factor BamD
MYVSVSRLVSLLLVCTLLAACAKTVPPPPKTAAAYFQEGEVLFEKGRYDEAIEAWGKVRDSYYSPELNVLAELKIAEAYFLAEKYVEAAAAYEDFLKQHPDHGRTAEALFFLGMSYYQQRLTADRDQTATRNALVTFETLRKRFPGSIRAEEVKAFIQHCRNRLASHELYVGQFYLRSGHPGAAIPRLEGLFQDYPDFAERDAAWFYLGQAYLETGRRQDASEAINRLLGEFPASEYGDRGRKLLRE